MDSGKVGPQGIDVSRLTPGMYTIWCTSENETRVARLIRP
jgi:hypothetical protein